MTTMSCERIAPTLMPAVMCLNADGAQLFATLEARKLCERWNQGLKDGTHRNGGKQDLRLPAGIGSMLRAAFNRGWDIHTTGVRVHHPSVPELAVTIHMGGSPPEPQSRPHCLLMFVVDAASSPVETSQKAAQSLQQLTPSERRVALLVADGLRNEEVAQRLQRSRRTVEYQLNAIFRKLEMRSRTQLVRALA
jgi:DNA-binding CsgD family transcriptional regulator